ncbi:MAG TPA: hypothetical protein PLO98_08830 [Bacteroidia bacterium]|nr:hypothetical protein [Bacteroidia bacterium]
MQMLAGSYYHCPMKLLGFKICALAILYFCVDAIQAQTIHVVASVKGNDATLPVVGLMIVNKSTGTGFFSPDNNFFSAAFNKSDTIMVNATGYSVKKICFNDSLVKDTFRIAIILEKPIVTLKPVTIIPPRELEVIQKDIEKLGYKKEDYMVTGIDAFESPITFLYQSFSKRERAKRDIAQKKNEDNKRKLLKELFRKYVDFDIMNLSEDQFDNFIDFINVDDNFLKNSTQYDFILFVKRKFEMYKALKKQ